MDINYRPKLSRGVIWFFEFILIAIFSLFFCWITGLLDGSGFGMDMDRYFLGFINLSRSPFDLFKYIQQSSKDPLSIVPIYLFRIFGFSFYMLLLSITFLYYRIALNRIKTILGFQSFYLQIILLLFFSPWLTILVATVLRQGISLLFIFAFAFQSYNQKSFNKNTFKDLFTVFIASCVHFSNVLILPFIFIRGIFKKYLLFFNILFYFIFILYIAGILVPIKSFITAILGDSFELIFRAMAFSAVEHYDIGPTVNKALSILLPVLLTDILFKYYTTQQRYRIEPILIFYKYISILGMLFSGFPYNDRILLIGWIFIPIILILSFNILSRIILKQYYIKV